MIVLTGKELGEYQNIKELRQLALNYYKNNIQGQFVMHSHIGKIKFTNKGYSELRHYSSQERKLQVVAKLLEIVKTAKYINSEPKHKERKDSFIEFHNLKNEV